MALINPSLFQLGFSLVAMAAVAVAYFRTSLSRSTTELQTQNIAALKERSNEQDRRIKENQLLLGTLEAEIKVIKTLPLQQLSSDYHSISETLNIIKDHLGAINQLLAQQQELLVQSYRTNDNQAQSLMKGAVKAVLTEGTQSVV